MPDSGPRWSFLYSHLWSFCFRGFDEETKVWGQCIYQSHKQPPTSAWRWNLSLSLAPKDHSWEGPSSLEVEEKEEEGGRARRIGRGRREPEQLGAGGKERGGRESPAVLRLL